MAPEDGPARPITNRRNVLKWVAGGSLGGIAGCTGGGEETETTTVLTTESTESTGSTETTQTTETTTTDEVQMGGELVATFHTNLNSFDPTEMSTALTRAAFGLVYEPLVSIDFSGQPQPVLAESVEQMDETTFRFALREGVTFHNGDSLSAQNVQKELNRYEGTPQAANVTTWYDSSEIVDDQTIDVNLSQPYAPLLIDLAWVPILPEGVADGEIDLRENPTGSGPYTFEEYQPDGLFRLSRNEDHWFEGNDVVPETPPIETITFRIIAERSSMLAALQSGEVDIINTIPPGSVPDLEANDEYVVDEEVSGGHELLLFPQHEAADTPFQNRKVRRGVARLIPRDGIIESVFDNVGQPAWAPVSPLVQQFTSSELQTEMRDEYVGYDTERAEQLLTEGFDEAGYDAPFETTIAMGGSGTVAQSSQIIQQSLQQSGFFEVDLEQYEVTSFVGRMTSSDSHTYNEIYNIGFGGGWDPSGYVSMFYSRRTSPACCNVNNFQSEQIDSLIEQGLTTFDAEERASIYEELQRLIVRESPGVFYRFGMEQSASAAGRVQGFETYPLGQGYYNGIYAPFADRFTWLQD